MSTRRLLPMLGHTFGKRSAVTCALKCDNACAGEVCNTSKNSYFRDVVSAEVSRRAALGAGAVAAFTAAVTLDTTDASAAAGPKPLGGKAVIGDGQLKFAPIAPVTSTVDAMTVPEGYSWHPIIRWGDPLFADSPAFDPQNPTQVKIGRRLAIKILNAAKFVLSFPVPEGAEVTHALDASMLTALDQVVREATRAYENYDQAKALEITEAFFWTFCDDYLELVKERAYDQTDVNQASAALALRLALSTLLRLLAPIVSFATEEAWSWFDEGSIHTATWPEPLGIDGNPAVLATASEALIGIRRAKTEAKASQKTPVATATISAPAAKIDALRAAADDLRAVGRIAELEFAEADELAVTAIELAPVEG